MQFNNLLQYKSKLKLIQLGKQSYVFDVVRKKNILLTPEEMVRQMIIHYLIEAKGYRLPLLQVEKKIIVNGVNRRFDIISYNRRFKPLLLVECKSHKITLNQSTFEQIARYNLNLKVKYLLVTNGHSYYCYEVDYDQQRLRPLEEIPEFELEKGA